MLVKICGIQTEEAAHTAASAGADFIGFVFAPSKRQIQPEAAKQIAKNIPQHIKKVGVFVNEDAGKMQEIAAYVGLDYIQLHGDEPPETAEALPYKIIKAFPVDPDHLEDIKEYPCDFYLLDSPFGKQRGGNGTQFDWNLTKQLALDSEKVILAGGLKPSNISEAIERTSPAAVDVSSGVETDGEKNEQKIEAFIDNAKNNREDDTNGSK